MNIQSKLPTTPDEFLRWNEGREGKWDFVDGRAVDMMVRVSRNHAVLCSNLLYLLRMRLTAPVFVVASADFGVKTEHSVRYPDILVDGVRGSGRDLAASEPLFIAEVLSPATMAEDLGAKSGEYQTIGSLRHYLVLAQDEPRVWLWARGADGNWSGPDMIAGEGETIPLPGLGISLLMKNLYEGIELFPA